MGRIESVIGPCLTTAAEKVADIAAAVGHPIPDKVGTVMDSDKKLCRRVFNGVDAATRAGVVITLVATQAGLVTAEKVVKRRQ